MSNTRLVWSDTKGDLRKEKKKKEEDIVSESALELKLRRLTSGKGRTIVEISNLPKNTSWCKSLAKELKKKLGVGGTYKNEIIEIHGETMQKLMSHLDLKKIRYKKIGG